MSATVSLQELPSNPKRKKEKKENKKVPHPPSTRAHEVDREPTTVITRPGTRTIPRAVDLPHTALVRGNDLLGPIDGRGFTRAHHRKGRRRIARASAAAGGDATLEVRRSWAESREAAGAALRGEAAVATVAAGGLGAAFDVGRGAGAGVADVGSAVGAAGGGPDADSGGAAGAGAGAVFDGAGGKDVCVGIEEEAGEGGEEEEEEGLVSEMHLCWWVVCLGREGKGGL